MNGLDEPMAPQTFLYGCVLEAGKEVVFNPDDDDLEHQLDLRMVCVDPSTKDELHMVEVEGQDAEGQKVKAVLVSLKPSTLPSACLGGYTITPPAVFRLKAGSGPIHISGQHLVMMDADQSFDEDEDDDEEEEEEEEDVKTSKKRPATSPAAKSQKKMKMEVEDDDDDDEEDDDDEDDEDEEDEDDDEADEDDEESMEEESPVKAKAAPAKPIPSKQTPSKPKAPAQNGKSSKPNTPAKKQEKTPKGKGDKSPKTPPTPKGPLSVPEIKAKMMEAVKKGVTLPKAQPKFENFVKHGHKVTEPKVIAELWKWRQALKE
ncbi:nucleophosmin 1a [Simochromis diagramma]|uniref:nucleophosmin 1a n=1 Tax=Simochromis diagramma TaxID=43689 RepID=UPI001A7ED037|nr:nucleophosmin 1a [Simochromis diagramma]